ncbi:glycosyltransferase [Siculibacillus lacustris]|nr:glycosyltransferase [Siculibacillus lacustris]
MTTDLTFTIVVNTYNRAAWLAETLAALRALRGPAFEVVVVDGPSTDGTAALLAAQAGAIKVRRCAEANLSMSRNIGIAAAAGDIVAFIDDDAVPHPDWLIELAAPYADPAVGAVGGFTIDNTGVRFQVRKTICDRFGNAHSVSPLFDERPLCFPGTPAYPSLLGTNSSFRRSILREIGGFDHTFVYLLDETDVCLRIVDAGHQIHYAPRALVFHQFAESHIRNVRRLPKTLYPSSVSKAYFVQHHGARAETDRAALQLEAYRDEILRSNAWLFTHSDISAEHRSSLDQDLGWGIAEGLERARAAAGRTTGDLVSSEDVAFLPMPRPNDALTIVLVSRSFPPANDAGIARWTSMVARGLAARGHAVHVVTGTQGERNIAFRDGFWRHEIHPDDAGGAVVAADLDLPPNIAAWAAAVRREVASLASFGVDVVSFPVWDVEGAALLDGCDAAVVMSLHTTYALAKPFKPEWSARPLYEHFMVRRMIAHEADLLRRTPTILANSEAIVNDLEATYGVTFRDRAAVVPHGTLDPLAASPARRTARAADGFLVGWVGRFEPRKGIDVAAAALVRLLAEVPGARVVFAGDDLDAEGRAIFAAAGASALVDDPRVGFVGSLSRSALDDLYAKCDVVVMPSRYESFGLVAIEAAAAGAVVVAGAVGGLAEVVRHGETGFLVPFDGTEVATIARHLVDLARDPDRRRTMGAAARRLYETDYTVEAMVDGIERVYARAVAERRKTP